MSDRRSLLRSRGTGGIDSFGTGDPVTLSLMIADFRDFCLAPWDFEGTILSTVAHADSHKRTRKA
jgi:hypothetical protein